jgi:hypothetical protein
MTDHLITDGLISQILSVLQGEPSLLGAHISYEVQDDFQHLLISVALDEMPEVVGAASFRRIGELVNSLMPARQGEYTWMVNFKRGGKIVDSRFGGDQDCPASGL